MGILVNPHVSLYIATGRSSFLDAIGSIRFIRFSTGRALTFSLTSRSGFSSLAGDGRGSRSTGASIHSHSDSEGDLLGEDECLWDSERLMMCV